MKRTIAILLGVLMALGTMTFTWADSLFEQEQGGDQQQQQQDEEKKKKRRKRGKGRRNGKGKNRGNRGQNGGSPETQPPDAGWQPKAPN